MLANQKKIKRIRINEMVVFKHIIIKRYSFTFLTITQQISTYFYDYKNFFSFPFIYF